jgi:MFS family permease
LMVAALFAGNLAIKPFTTALMRRFGIKRVLLVNGVLSVGWFGLLAVVRPGLPVWVIAVILFVSGALRSIGFTAYNSLAFAEVEGDDLTHGNTLNASVQELASGVGIAVAALLLSQLTPLVGAEPGLAYSWTYLVLTALLALTLIETVRLPRDAGAEVSGTRIKR